MDWCERFGFQFDPFFDKPLESDSEMEKWLVIQKNMEERITPLIRQMSHMPFLSLIVGDRGVGKSTFMYYSMNLAKKSNYLPVYVGLDHIQLETSRRPTYYVTENLLYGFGARLLDSLHDLKPSFFSENRNSLYNLARYLGLDYQESEGFIPNGKPYHFEFFDVKRYVLVTLNLLKRSKIPILLSIDNLDKVTKQQILEDFFSAPFAQTFFEDLKSGGVSILIAIGPPFSKVRERKSSLKYLSQAVFIDAFSPTQAAELLTKRIKYSNDPAPRNPFEEDAMIAIGLRKKGITRDILTEARNLCLKAHEQGLSTISKEFVDKGITSFSESRIFYKLIDQSEEIKECLLRLCSLAAEPNIDSKQIVSAINDVATGKNITVKGEVLNELIDADIIMSTLREKYRLTDSMVSLLKAVQKSDWNVDRFLDWIFVRDSIRILADGIPGINAKNSIDRFGPIPGVSRPTIRIIVKNAPNIIQTRTLHQKALSQLAEAKMILNNIGTLSWDDIDNVNTYKEISRALTAFLCAFSKLYISCATSRTVRLKSFKSVDLIENVIHHFQEEYNVSFKSFFRFQRLRANMKGLLRGGLSPSHSHIKDAFEDFQEIVTEFTNIWQDISNRFVTLEAPDERHESILKEVSELAMLMGYSIERPEYKRFKIDGGEYYRLGFSKFPIDETSINMVREKRLKNRFNQIKSYFFLSYVKPKTRNKATVKDVLTFLHKCRDLISILDEENAEMPEGWPRYLLVYVSTSGFEAGIQAALKSIVMSPKSEVQILDYFRLKNLKRQLAPARGIPIGAISERELGELWTKDLEQLLRLRLSITKIIREKFEKIVTILLADMKDFTRRTMKGNLESAEAVQKLSDILERNVSTYDGVGANTEGDSFIATFDNPESAALAALKSIKELEQYNKQVKEENRIYVRIGICTGEVLFKVGRPFIGNAVNIAARIMKEAEPNRVVTTDDTQKKISFYRNFEFRSIGKTKLKGIEKPLVMYEIRLKEISDVV